MISRSLCQALRIHAGRGREAASDRRQIRCRHDLVRLFSPINKRVFVLNGFRKVLYRAVPAWMRGTNTPVLRQSRIQCRLGFLGAPHVGYSPVVRAVVPG